MVFQAVIFDMDGTLVDTERLWHMAEGDVLAAHGRRYDAAIHAAFIGLSIDELSVRVVRAYDLEHLDPQVYKQGVDKRVKELLAEHTQPQPGAAELVAYVAQRNIPRAVASNSSVSVIEATLANQPWAQYLPLRCSAEFVAHAKPAPDIYLHTAAELGIAPEFCVAIEDSVNGAKAVAAAGMTCLAVPDRSHAFPADFHAITPYIFTTLSDVLEFLRPRLPR